VKAVAERETVAGGEASVAGSCDAESGVGFAEADE